MTENKPYVTKARQFFGALSAKLPKGVSSDVIEFDIEDSGRWLVDMASASVRELKKTDAPKVNAIVRARDRDFMALVEGRMTPEDGVLTGRLRLSGEAAVLARLSIFFQGGKAS